MPKNSGIERRTKPRGPQGLSLRVQFTAVVVLLAVVPSVSVALWLMPLAYPEAWRDHAPWFLAWTAGLVAVVAAAAVVAARRMVGPLSRIARELDALRGRHDLRATAQIRHIDGDPREVASVKRSVLSLLQRVDEDRERRTTLLATLTHDINTSVLAARNVVDLLAQGRVATDAEVTHGLARELGTLHDRTQQLIDMLRLDRVELDLARERLDLRSLVEDAVTRVRDAVARDDVEVVVAGEASLEGDRAALVRAIENLVANALRHARSRVSIDIRPGAVRVTDDGAGFAATFDAMTQPYTAGASAGGQPDSTEGGTGGLGLYLVRLIAEAHGGRLILEDTGPHGSTVGLHVGK